MTNYKYYSGKNNPPGRSGKNDPGELIVNRSANEPLRFGRGVVTGTGTDGVKVPVSGSDKFEGVVSADESGHLYDADGYIIGNNTNDPVGVFQRGFPVVVVEEDVTPADVVRMRVVQDKAPGSQSRGFSVTKTAASASGLANDATAYTATITVDGVAKPISVVGSAAQTLGTVVSEVNVDLGASATMTFVAAGGTLPNGTVSANGALVVTSATKGATSSVSITDGTLFAALTNINPAFDTAVAGSNDFDVTKEPGMFRKTAIAGQTALLAGCRWASSSNGEGRAILQLTGETVTMSAD